MGDIVVPPPAAPDEFVALENLDHLARHTVLPAAARPVCPIILVRTVEIDSDPERMHTWPLCIEYRTPAKRFLGIVEKAMNGSRQRGELCSNLRKHLIHAVDRRGSQEIP